MISKDLIIRIDKLIELSELTLKNQYGDEFGKFVISEHFYELRTAGLSFIQNLYTSDHPYFKEFKIGVDFPTPESVGIARGIFKAIRNEIEGGWIFTIKDILSAEIFNDIMESAEHLLSEGYKDPAAVMIGSILEEHLRQLCIKNSIEIVFSKKDKNIPKKADTLNNELAKTKIYNLIDQKSVTSWLGLRNNAAHGKYDTYTKDQVEIMYQGVLNFIARTI